MAGEDIIEMMKGHSKGFRIVKFIILLFVLFIIGLIFNPFIIVGAGERGVLLNFGAVQPSVYDEGLHFMIPVMQKIIRMDVKVHKSQTDAESVSKDLQDTRSTIAVNYHIAPDKANWIYQNIGVEYKDRIIDPAVQEVVKAITARYRGYQVFS